MWSYGLGLWCRVCACVCVCLRVCVRGGSLERAGAGRNAGNKGYVLFSFVYMLTLSADPLCLLMLLRISRDRRRRSFVENTLEVTHNHTVTPKRRSVEEGEERTEGQRVCSRHVFSILVYLRQDHVSGPYVRATCRV